MYLQVVILLTAAVRDGQIGMVWYLKALFSSPNRHLFPYQIGIALQVSKCPRLNIVRERGPGTTNVAGTS